MVCSEAESRTYFQTCETMPSNFRVISPQVKETILKQVKQDGRRVSEVAKEFSVSTVTVYNWLSKEVAGTGKSKYFDQEGRTTLHYASKKEEIEDILNCHPEWLSHQDKKGLTPLHF